MTLGLVTLLATPSSDVPSAPPITSHGPNDLAQITAIDAFGEGLARFIVHGTKKSSFTISRVLGGLDSPPQQICEAHMSSLSGSTRLVVHGQDVKLEKGGYGDAVLRSGTMGRLEWRPKSGGVLELRDGRKTVVAMGSTKEFKLKVFVTADEMVLDV